MVNNMEWFSPEVQQFYNTFNKVYTTIIKNYHPYIQLIYIDPYTFNMIFLSEESYKMYDVKVIICTSFPSEYYEISKNRSLGSDVTTMFIDLKKMVPGNEIISNKSVYPQVEINEAEYCKGLIKYDY
jgi:hypothetical protein